MEVSVFLGINLWEDIIEGDTGGQAFVLSLHSRKVASLIHVCTVFECLAKVTFLSQSKDTDIRLTSLDCGCLFVSECGLALNWQRFHVEAI